jgi:toxin-antitoxin system PIN domain toxin
LILPDINLLLYAHIDAFPEHRPARKWWNDVMNGEVPVALAEAVLFGFVRVATNPRALRLPVPVETALACVEGWLEHPNTRLLVQTPESAALALSLLRKLGTAGNLTTDAQIAALAIHYQATVCSRDTDFARFDGLRWHNPLAL